MASLDLQPQALHFYCMTFVTAEHTDRGSIPAVIITTPIVAVAGASDWRSSHPMATAGTLAA